MNFVKNAKVFYLATIDNDKPRVRPFGALNIFEDKLYIQTGKVKAVSKQMSINPNIEISAFYRKVFATDPTTEIKKEYVIKE